MKKNEIVKSKIIFNNIINKGKHIENKYYVLYYMNNPEDINKFGVAVGTKVGNAVIRNKIKRQVRTIIDKNKSNLSKHFYYIIICRKGLLNITYDNMNEEFVSLLKKGELYEEKTI